MLDADNGSTVGGEHPSHRRHHNPQSFTDSNIITTPEERVRMGLFDSREKTEVLTHT
jgi:hypothetical protein